MMDRNRFVGCVLLLFVLTWMAPLPGWADLDLDSYIQGRMEALHLPGFAACIVKGDRIVWSKAYGLANLENHTPAATDTVWLTASISKTVVATALMQLEQAGRFSLDDPVNNYLPFSVFNPNHPGEQITFRQVLSHVSSIKDNWDVTEPLYVQGDSPLALGVFLRDFLTPGGAYYQANGNFHRYSPGAEYDYSNIGFALAGYLVEAITGTDFGEYCRVNIFEPLGMTETSWFMADLDPAKVAMPYAYHRRGGGYEAYGHYGFPEYPSGTLRSSINQLAVFLRAFINKGQVDGKVVLAPETVERMMAIQYPGVDEDQGLAWYYLSLGGRRVCGHSGADDGAVAEMFFREQDGVGAIMFANGDLDDYEEEDSWMEVLERLFSEADNY